ncbi:hypothetical protein FRB90_001061, partial [Tulasnella sp. 427]
MDERALSAAAVDEAFSVLVGALEQDSKDEATSLTPESMMSHLDILAERFEVTGEAIQLVMRTRAALFRRQRNALLPISQLPSELLSPILLHSFDQRGPRKMKVLQNLAQVAWRWWQTIKADPEFWQDIVPPLKSVGLQIRKAMALPMHLSWGADIYNTDDDDSFQRMVQTYAERWMSITLGSSLKGALEALCATHFPRLLYLKTGELLESRNWELDLSQYPKLKDAYLPIIPHISRSTPSNLRTLHLDLNWNASSSSRSLKYLLLSTPQLVDFTIRDFLDERNTPTPRYTQIIDLPILQRLEFRNVARGQTPEAIPLLSQLRAPNLQKLELQYDFDLQGWPIGITGREVFGALLTGPHAVSTARRDSAPLYSVIRNAASPVSWRVGFVYANATVSARGCHGEEIARLSFNLSSPKQEQVLDHILPHITSFSLPVDLSLNTSHLALNLEFWHTMLDTMPTLRSLALIGPRQEPPNYVVNGLSSPPGVFTQKGPRAPNLEKLAFRNFEMSNDDIKEAVGAMMQKRRELYALHGVASPPKLA